MKSDITVGDTFTYRMKTTEDMSATKLVEAAGKKFVFEVDCFDEAEKIGSAKHTRFVIETKGFMAALEAKVK